MVESGGVEKLWRIFVFAVEWRRFPENCVENLVKSGFSCGKNIGQMNVLGLFFRFDYITMWLTVAQSGVLWWRYTIKVGEW